MSNAIEDHVLKRFKILNKLGKGAYGIVWKAVDKITGETVALKKIFDAFRNSTDSQRTYREIMFLTELRGRPGIVGLKCVLPAYNNRDVYLVFEHMESDLHTVIRSNILQDIHKRFITFQLLQILHMIHSGELLHRDLKPSNILLNSDCSIKLADFGLARSLKTFNDKAPILTDYVATRWYRAPEILIGSNRYSKAVDMWAVGCIVAELISGKPLFPGSSTMNQICKVLTFTGIPNDEDIKSLDSQFSNMMFNNIKHIKKMDFESFFMKPIPHDAKDFIYKLLEFYPEKRLSSLEALNHPYVMSFNTGKYKLITLPAPIHIPTDDNVKYSMDNYRNLVNEYINAQNAHNGQAPPPPEHHEEGHLKSRLFNKFKKPQSLLPNGCVKKKVEESSSSSTYSSQMTQPQNPTITNTLDPNTNYNIHESTKFDGNSNDNTSEYSELYVSGDSPTKLLNKQNMSDSDLSGDSYVKNVSPTNTTQDIFARFKLHAGTQDKVKPVAHGHIEYDNKNYQTSDQNNNTFCINGKYYVKHPPLQFDNRF